MFMILDMICRLTTMHIDGHLVGVGEQREYTFGLVYEFGLVKQVGWKIV